MTPLGIRQIPVGAASAAVAVPGESDTSCILTLGQCQGASATSMTFNGSPSANLTGCTLRSNTSMRCNGHDTGASASVSTGTTSGCSNPQSNANSVTDIYGPLASNITTRCTAYPGATWTPSASPVSPNRTADTSKPGRVEYHVCGTLTLSGTGELAFPYAARDNVIIVENGGITVADNATLTATRTAFVLTGNNTVASSISFPRGNGQGSSLAISPPTNSDDPWAGISLYQNPSLTFGVDQDWGPGATLIAGGVAYLPKADVTLSGNAQSTATACSKLVVSTLTVNGNVDLGHTGAACSSLGVKQWSKPTGAYMVQ